MFQKFARLDVLEVKSAPDKVRSASLSKFADFNDYRTEDGYLYVRVRAISSRVNKNHDGWPAAELKKSYQTFIGKPLFVDHHNSDPQKARGVVRDAQLHIEDAKTSALDPYYASAPSEHLPATWVELLLEVDAKRFPKLAKAIIAGDIDGVSMGANVERSVCSHCKNEARSPEEYCSHVRSKGAYFDYIDRNGHKVSKRAYEDCYDIGFFELSFVFDPADETALISDVRKSKIAHAVQHEADTKTSFEPGALFTAGPLVIAAVRFLRSRAQGNRMPALGDIVNFLVRDGADPWEAQQAAQQAIQQEQSQPQQQVAKTADRNPAPQSEMMSAPEKVDTLRQDQTCPICGSDMEDGVCEVCNYEEPPEGFDNPDLEKAQQVDQQMRDQDAQQAAQGLDQNTPNNVQPSPTGQPQGAPSGMPPGMPMAASTGNDVVAHTVMSEKTSAQGGRINTQERPILPVTRKVTDKPLNTKTVSDSSKPVESKTRKETMSDKTQKIADGATPEGTGVQADKRVDVEGVGGVSGDPLNGIKHENVEKSMEQKGGPSTDTWSGNEGDSLGQQDAVTSEDFEGSPLIGQPVAGTKQADFPGGDGSFPDHDPSHVELEGDLKEEVGERTKTFPATEMTVGTPVTDENANEVGGPMGTAIKAPLSAFQAAANAVKLAETEIELGLIQSEAKWDRIAELEDADPTEVVAELRAYAKVKTARAQAKTAATKTAGATSMPSLRPMAHVAGFDPAQHGVEEVNVEDSLW